MPAAVTEKFPARAVHVRLLPGSRNRAKTSRVAGETVALDATGALTVDGSDATATWTSPYRYTFEADVEDISRQHIANRSSADRASRAWYIGLRRPPTSPTSPTGTSVDVVAVDPKGNAVAGRRRDACRSFAFSGTPCAAPKAAASTPGTPNGSRCRPASGRCKTAATPVTVKIPVPEGGYYQLRGDGQRTPTAAGRGPTRAFYALGQGYTAWERFDHNRITLEPERKTWKPGETRAHHDPVAVGNGDGAAHRRARRHPPRRALRADVDAADRRGADHRSRHPERLRLGAAHSRPDVERSRRRTAAIRASRRSGSATPSSTSTDATKQLAVKVVGGSRGVPAGQPRARSPSRSPTRPASRRRAK